jgi:hypothetical protein
MIGEMTLPFPKIFMWRTPRLGTNRWLAIVCLVTTLMLCVILSGCSFASFAAAVETDLPVVIQMVTNITNIVAPGVSVAIQAAGGLALASLTILCGTPAIGASKCDPTSLVGQYQLATDSGVKTSLLQKIDIALTAVNSQINNMLALAKGLNPAIGAAIVTAVGIALETVTLLLTLIPVSLNPRLGVKLGVLHTSSSLYPQKPGTLKKRFNAAIGTQFPGAVVH